MSQWDLVEYMKQNAGKWFTTQNIMEAFPETGGSSITTKLKKISKTMSKIEKKSAAIKYGGSTRHVYHYRWKE